MKLFLILFVIFAPFAFAEVYLKGFVPAPGKFEGGKTLYTYETLRAGGAVMKAEIISIPFSGADRWSAVERQGKVLFQDSRTIGFRYQDKIILMKSIGRDRVLRLELDAADLD